MEPRAGAGRARHAPGGEARVHQGEAASGGGGLAQEPRPQLGLDQHQGGGETAATTRRTRRLTSSGAKKATSTAGGVERPRPVRVTQETLKGTSGRARWSEAARLVGQARLSHRGAGIQTRRG